MNPEPTVVICYGGAERATFTCWRGWSPWTVGSSRGSPPQACQKEKNPPSGVRLRGSPPKSTGLGVVSGKGPPSLLMSFEPELAAQGCVAAERSFRGAC